MVVTETFQIGEQQSESGASFEVIPPSSDHMCSIGATNFACPFKQLGLDVEGLFEQYISNADERWGESVYTMDMDAKLTQPLWQDCEPQQCAVMAQQVRFTKHWRKMRTSLLECRRNIDDMAKTLLEIYEGADLLSKDTLHDHVHAVMEKLAHQRKQLQDLESLTTEHMLCMRRAWVRKDTSEKSRVLWCASWGMTAIIGSVLGLLPPEHIIQLLLQTPTKLPKQTPKDIAKGDVTKNVIAVRLGFAGFACGAGLLSYWSWWQGLKRVEEESKLAAYHSKGVASTAQHELIWEGLLSGVEDLQWHAEQLKHITEAGREVRRRNAMMDVGIRLVGILNAIDEYTVWLDVRGYFPATFSAKNLVGYARYQRLRAAMASTDKPAMPALMAS